jgi:hypothetical protein
MINSLTNHGKNNITLDKILVKGQQTFYISTDVHEVTKEVEKHYKEAFKTRNSSFNQLSKDWKEEYSPKQLLKKSGLVSSWIQSQRRNSIKFLKTCLMAKQVGSQP